MDNPVCLWQVLVPCNYNDGRPVRTRHHREWDRQVQRITGGLTILSPGLGKWRDPRTGEEYTDRVIPVQVLCTTEQIKRIVAITIEHYRQLSVMYFKMSDWGIIHNCTEEQRLRFSRE